MYARIEYESTAISRCCLTFPQFSF